MTVALRGSVVLGLALRFRTATRALPVVESAEFRSGTNASWFTASSAKSPGAVVPTTMVGVAVGVTVAVALAVGVGGEPVGLAVAVTVALGVRVGVVVAVGTAVGVEVEVGVGLPTHFGHGSHADASTMPAAASTMATRQFEDCDATRSFLEVIAATAAPYGTIDSPAIGRSPKNSE